MLSAFLLFCTVKTSSATLGVSVPRALSRTYLPSPSMSALQWAPGPPAVNYDPIKSVEWALGSVQEVPGNVRKVCL